MCNCRSIFYFISGWPWYNNILPVPCARFRWTKNMPYPSPVSYWSFFRTFYVFTWALISLFFPRFSLDGLIVNNARLVSEVTNVLMGSLNSTVILLVSSWSCSVLLAKSCLGLVDLIDYIAAAEKVNITRLVSFLLVCCSCHLALITCESPMLTYLAFSFPVA